MARLVAAKTLRQILPEKWTTCRPGDSINRLSATDEDDFVEQAEKVLNAIDVSELAIILKRLTDEEAVVHLDDLVPRRTTLWEHRELVNCDENVITYARPSSDIKARKELSVEYRVVEIRDLQPVLDNLEAFERVFYIAAS